MADQLPWHVSIAFTRDRLIWLARRLLEIRARVVKAMLPVPGDTPWVLGVRAYEWTVKGLAEDAMSGNIPWLTAVPLPHHKFDLKIGGNPLHYFRGDPTHPLSRHILGGLKKTQGELFELAEPDDDVEEVWTPYVAVSADAYGNGLAVDFLEGSNKKNVRNRWRIPHDEPVSVVTPFRTTAKPGTKLRKPRVSPKLPMVKKGNDDDPSGT